MKVQNLTNNDGRAIPNQFLIRDDNGATYFQSYDSIIVKREYNEELGRKVITLDEYYWDYSKTTGKYRNQFLGETKKETEAKIKDGTYILADLNS